MSVWLRRFVYLLLVVAFFVYRPDRALKVASGMTAQTLCSAVFVAQRDPEAIFVQTVKPLASVAAPFLHYAVDREAKTVKASVVGLLGSKAAFYSGYGCRLEYPNSITVKPLTADVLPVAETPTFETSDVTLRAALDHIFSEDTGQVARQLKAVVIVRDGVIVGERYAPGYGPNTPLPSYSVAKSLTNALLGILVRQGKLTVEEPAPIASWHAANDPRAAITIDHLLRMESGLALAETGSGFDPVSRMLYLENDMAAFAETGTLESAPGTKWDYTSANTLILSRIIGEVIGGGGQEAYRRFAFTELFEPIGMRNVTLEFDGAGTQVSSTSILAPARDWARFGQLFLKDGFAPGGARLLPEGWVDYSRRPTLGSSYGAGFWTNAGPSEFAALRIKGGMPADTFFASGNRGQRIYIVPSERLVVVRLGMTHRLPDFDIAADLRLLRDTIAALKANGANPIEGLPL